MPTLHDKCQCVLDRDKGLQRGATTLRGFQFAVAEASARALRPAGHRVTSKKSTPIYFLDLEHFRRRSAGRCVAQAESCYRCPPSSIRGQDRRLLSLCGVRHFSYARSKAFNTPGCCAISACVAKVPDPNKPLTAAQRGRKMLLLDL